MQYKSSCTICCPSIGKRNSLFIYRCKHSNRMSIFLDRSWICLRSMDSKSARTQKQSQMSKKCDNSIRCGYCRTNFIFPVCFRRTGIEHDRPCSGCKGEGTAAEQGKCRIGDFYHRSGVCGAAYGDRCCRFIMTKPIYALPTLPNKLTPYKKTTSSCVRTGCFLL